MRTNLVADPNDWSFIQAMKDKSQQGPKRFVFHPGIEGQISARTQTIGLSSR
ncbi:hypothetical protein ABLO26_12370 [Neobacillus sp. 179-J 1A1 HS]|uniref:hypothetical protein n=1 Tax=Neobacillus driksii TaxID=3035913 RepID=UPI0035BBCC0C